MIKAGQRWTQKPPRGTLIDLDHPWVKDYGMVSFYALNEGSGNQVTDSLKNLNLGTTGFSSNNPWGVGSTGGLNCLSVGGTASSIVGPRYYLALPLMIVAAFKFIGATGSNAPIIALNPTNTSNTRGISLEQGSSLPSTNVLLCTPTTGSGGLINSGNLLAGDHVVAGVLTPTNGYMYVDGKLIGSTSGSYSAATYTATSTFMLGSGGFFANRIPGALIYWSFVCASAPPASIHQQIGGNPNNIWQIMMPMSTTSVFLMGVSIKLYSTDSSSLIESNISLIYPNDSSSLIESNILSNSLYFVDTAFPKEPDYLSGSIITADSSYSINSHVSEFLIFSNDTSISLESNYLSTIIFVSEFSADSASASDIQLDLETIPIVIVAPPPYPTFYKTVFSTDCATAIEPMGVGGTTADVTPSVNTLVDVLWGLMQILSNSGFLPESSWSYVVDPDIPNMNFPLIPVPYCLIEPGNLTAREDQTGGGRFSMHWDFEFTIHLVVGNILDSAWIDKIITTSYDMSTGPYEIADKVINILSQTYPLNPKGQPVLVELPRPMSIGKLTKYPKSSSYSGIPIEFVCSFLEVLPKVLP